jgi:type IV secretion system protein VirB9
MRRIWTGFSLALLIAAIDIGSQACAESMPVKGTVDPRIRTAVYKEDEVYKLYGFVGFDIELVFAEGEQYLGKGGGDLAGVTIDGVTVESFENHVLLKPAAAIVATNLVLYSNRRAYRFDYTVFARRPNRFADEVMYAVKFIYPDDPRGSNGTSSSADRVDRALHDAEKVKPRNLDYWYCGNRTLRPARAFDDGVQTHLLFPARAELPAVFLRNDDGTESLLNFTIDDGEMVIHRVAHRFVLRRGKLTGCVVNQSFVGGGERLESGTITPQVERVPKGVQP